MSPITLILIALGLGLLGWLGVPLDLFGVPSMVAGGRVFWGLDALPMLRAYLEGDSWFTSAAWDGVNAIPSAIPLRG